MIRQIITMKIPALSKDQLLRDLSHFIFNEDRESENRYKRNLTLSIQERIRKGISLTGDKLIKVENSNNLKLSFGINDSKFRIGDHIKLSADCLNWPEIECKIVKEENNYYIAETGSSQISITEEFAKDWIINESYASVIQKILIQSLSNLDNWENEEKRRIILNLLQKKSVQHYSIPNANEKYKIRKSIKAANLDKKQGEAFMKAISADLFHLVQGPPGTGKTYLLSQIANYLASLGKNVLITAGTHKAINNALLKVYETSNGSANIYKITRETKSEELAPFYDRISVVENLFQIEMKPEIGVIVGATAYETSRFIAKFDYTIFDEASQFSMALSIPPMLASDKYLFFGDHAQLNPIILGEYNQDYLHQSIFEYLYNTYNGTMLETCHRMNKGLLSYSSQAFYMGKLKPTFKNKNTIIKLKSKPKKHFEILNPKISDVVVLLKHEDCNYNSLMEAELACELVNELIECGMPQREIGIITPYRAQNRLIKNVLQRKNLEINEILIDTVNKFQGQEREVIIFSMTQSNFDTTDESLEFFFDPKRLNVAITRSKFKRIVICSSAILKQKSDVESIDKKIKLLCDFINTSEEIINYENWKY